MKRLSLLTLVLALAACGSSSKRSSSSSGSSGSSAATSAAGTTRTIAATASETGGTESSTAPSGAIEATMKNLGFHPSKITARVGQTVTWTNQDGPPHNVTYVSGPKFSSSGTMNTGATFSLKLTQPGTITYICSIHPFMKATIVVSR